MRPLPYMTAESLSSKTDVDFFSSLSNALREYQIKQGGV